MHEIAAFLCHGKLPPVIQKALRWDAHSHTGEQQDLHRTVVFENLRTGRAG